jgi:hypothetical protein
MKGTAYTEKDRLTDRNIRDAKSGFNVHAGRKI